MGYPGWSLIQYKYKDLNSLGKEAISTRDSMPLKVMTSASPIPPAFKLPIAIKNPNCPYLEQNVG
jgi:hypothetical protein